MTLAACTTEPRAAFQLTDTIVAGNVGSGGAADIGGPDPSGVTGTYNLIGDGGSGGIQGGSDGNIVLTSLIDLGLAPLGSYGGSTQTMALLAGSPALGAGTPISGITVDQRGEPIGSSVDIGAFQGQEGAPAITSADNTTFVDGVPGSFTVTATGTPPPTLSESGTLPSGVSFDASTGVLSGTPATTDLGGTYTVTFTASNSVGSAATQSFALLIAQPPAITSANNTTFVEGSPGTFTVTATGVPTPTLSESGVLPSGVTFNADTGVLSGTPAATAGGEYPLTFTASTGIGSAAKQEFDLWVVSPSYSLNAPTKFVVTGVTSTSIAFSWTDNDPSATGYDVQEAVAGSTNFAPVTGSPFGPGTTSATATGLTSGLNYQFEVRAVAASGSSAWLSSGDVETLVSTALSLSANPNPLQIWVTATNAADQSNDVVFTATVTNTSGTSDEPVGQVNFQDLTTGTDLGTSPLTDGSASLDAPSFSLGDHTIIATYTPYPVSLFAGSATRMTEAVEAFTGTTVSAAPLPGCWGGRYRSRPRCLTICPTASRRPAACSFRWTAATMANRSPWIKMGRPPSGDSSLTLGGHSISASYTPTGDFSCQRRQRDGDVLIPATPGLATLATATGTRPATGTPACPESGDDVDISNLAVGAIAMINLGPADAQTI